VKVGLEYRLVPLGSRPSSGIHFIDILARVAMMFGGVTPGDAGRLLSYAKERAKAISIVFPGLSEEETAVYDAFRLLGIPILSAGEYEGEQWIRVSPAEAVKTGMDSRGRWRPPSPYPWPVSAFEGKSIRKEDMYVEFGGGGPLPSVSGADRK
jgi:acetyl-CoA decarbonylase/synthase complex subunit beta/acetyl-CoA synthase